MKTNLDLNKYVGSFMKTGSGLLWFVRLVGSTNVKSNLLRQAAKAADAININFSQIHINELTICSKKHYC